MGESENSSFALGLGIIGILLVFLAIIAYVNLVLRSFSENIRSGSYTLWYFQEKKAGAKHFT